MATIVIQTNDSFDGQKIKQVLDDPYYKVHISFGRKSTFNHLVHDDPDVFIYDVQVVNSIVVEYLKEMYLRGFKKPTILLVEKVGSLGKELDSFQNVHILEKGLIKSILPNLTLKLVEDPNLKPQSYRRYETYQELNVESIQDGRGVRSFMTNLSVGGAYCVFEENPKLAKGDLVRLKIKLEEVNKFHNLHAQVVWSNIDQVTGQTGLGLKFISEQDMYKQLLNKL